MTIATAGRIAEAQEQIIAEMSALADPLARYEYLIAQGRMLREPGATIRNERNAIPGCQASVWIQARLQDGRLRLRDRPGRGERHERPPANAAARGTPVSMGLAGSRLHSYQPPSYTETRGQPMSQALKNASLPRQPVPQ